MADTVLKKEDNNNKAVALFLYGGSMSDTNSKWNRFVKEYVPYILILIFVLLVKKFVVTPIKVNGISMNDTLKNGDVMILNIIGYRFHDIERFDIVVVDEGEEYLIKRVIGLPGEEVKYEDQQLYINGKKVKDSYGIGETSDFKVKVPKNSYYVLGDNRMHSLDSRFFGAFSKDKIVGKTQFTIFPFNRIGNKK